MTDQQKPKDKDYWSRAQCPQCLKYFWIWLKGKPQSPHKCKGDICA